MRAFRFQTLSDIKERNREYAHWSKNIREAVEYFGNQGWNEYYDDKYNKDCNNQRGPYFCGMSHKIVVPQIMIRLNGPCSSTKQLEIAQRFSGDAGIII